MPTYEKSEDRLVKRADEAPIVGTYTKEQLENDLKVAETRVVELKEQLAECEKLGVTK